MPVLAEMEKQSFENFPKKEGKDGVEKVYGRKPGGKRSFLQKAKRFGKQGRLGRGTQIDSETYSYFVKILEVLKNDDFATDEEREIFVENSLSLTEEKEVELSSNQLVSRVVETILPFASESTLLRFCQAFTPSLRVIVADPFSCHVLETLLEISSANKWRESDKLTEWFEKTAMFVLNNFEDFTFETYASFTIKKVLECLSGYVHPPNEKELRLAVFKRSSLLVFIKGVRKSHPKWEKILQDFAKRFMAWPQFNDLVQKPNTARLMQNVLEAVHRTANSETLTQEFVLRVLSAIPAPSVPSSIGNRVLEVCLTVSNEATYNKIFKEYYKGRLSLHYVEDGPTFTIQKIISSAPTEKSLESVLKELSPDMENLIRFGHIDVILELAQKCNIHKGLQKALFTVLKNAIENTFGKDANLALCIAGLGKEHERGQSNSFGLKVTYFGTLTVEALMDFDAPYGPTVIKSISELESSKLHKLSLDRKGSFILSKYFKSWVVSDVQKEKILDKLKENLVELAMTTFGSRIIDEIWLWANIKQKVVVAEQLSERVPQLAANKFGRFVVEKMGLNSFKRDRKEWLEHMASTDKRKKDASDIAEQLGLLKQSSTSNNNGTKFESEEDSKQGSKKKKSRKSSLLEENNESTLNETEEMEQLSSESPKKKKNKKRKSQVDTEDVNASLEEVETETPKKKKKNRKSEATEVTDAELEEAPKKKKKNRKSEVLDESVDLEQTETPKKNKRKSELVEQNESAKKKKDRKSKQF